MKVIEKDAKSQGKISRATIPKPATGFHQREGESLSPETLKAMRQESDD